MISFIIHKQHLLFSTYHCLFHTYFPIQIKIITKGKSLRSTIQLLSTTMTNYLSDKEGGPRDGPGRSGGFGEAHEVRTSRVRETRSTDSGVSRRRLRRRRFCSFADARPRRSRTRQLARFSRVSTATGVSSSRPERETRRKSWEPRSTTFPSRYVRTAERCGRDQTSDDARHRNEMVRTLRSLNRRLRSIFPLGAY